MDMEELKKLSIDKLVDARGMACPGPLLEAKRSITQVQKGGGTLEVLSSDKSTNQDVPAWSKKVGHEYLGTIEEAGYWRIFVRRGNR